MSILQEKALANRPWDESIPKQGKLLETFPKEGEKQKGTKHDDGKSRMDLLDSEFLEGVGHVLRFGASKYDAHNWRGGIAYSRLIGAAMRHLAAINKGENIDPESGMQHVHHLGCCVMFLSAMMRHRPDLDDRWKPSELWQK
jgi:hypothetical protein